MKKVLLLLLILLAHSVNAQQNRIKLGVWGLPLFQSGFGIGTIGLERINAKQSSSWQLHFGMSGGSIAVDAQTHKRKWITAERTWYLNPDPKKYRYFFTLFCETGSRATLPGYISYPPDSVLRETKRFEISPGSGIGFQYIFKKKCGFELTAGPKIIFAKGNYHYYNSITKNEYEVSFDKISAGFRLMGSFYYQF